MNEIVLIGGGGHCKSCIDVIEQEAKYRIAGIVDHPSKLHGEVLGYEIFACDEDLPRLVKEYAFFLLTIGQIESAAVRIGLAMQLDGLKASFPVIISPFACVSRHARMGKGTVVMHHSVVNADAKIGDHCIINTGATVEHDVVIGNFCHISTSAVVNGGVTLGDRCFFGSNAVSREGVTLGDDVFVGCNTRVTRNVPGGTDLK